MKPALALTLTLAALGCDDPDAAPPLDAAPALDAATPPDAIADAEPDAAWPPIPAAAWIHDIEAPLPRWLGDTGLYADLRTLAPRAGVVRYAPPYPLYSNGTDKHRLLYLPPGEVIEATGDHFDFPVGAVLAKTFSYEDIEGREGTVAVETRLSFRRAAGWDFAEYHWNREGDEARLVGGSWSARRVTLAGAEGDFVYTLPGLLECRGCHEAAASPVLGITAHDLDPALPAALFAAPPEAIPVEGRTPAETAVMRYLVGNCTHCHHGGAGENASFDLRPAALVAHTVDQPTESSASGSGIRVVPGDPEGSALYIATVDAHRPDDDSDFKPMPPLGIDRPDERLPALLRAWIEELDR
ncbi:MAG: hypothetical protein R3F65_24425 [bacterium]